MAKICPITGVKVLYLECLECDNYRCRMNSIEGETEKTQKEIGKSQKELGNICRQINAISQEQQNMS